MSCALMLQRAGLDVTLVDLDPNWRVAGAGITITAATFGHSGRSNPERVMEKVTRTRASGQRSLP
jgi:2-polyprenyl-6-methoxyphenol hydroxylase-like FAD-dependent oxidoreductase